MASKRHWMCSHDIIVCIITKVWHYNTVQDVDLCWLDQPMDLRIKIGVLSSRLDFIIAVIAVLSEDFRKRQERGPT